MQGHPEISVEDIARATGAALTGWGGDYSVVSLGKDEAEDLSPSFRTAAPAARDLFLDLDEDEE